MTLARRYAEDARHQGLVAGVLLMLAFSALTFALVFYLHQSALWMVCCVGIALLSSLAGFFRLSEYLRLDRMARHEAMLQRGIITCQGRRPFL